MATLAEAIYETVRRLPRRKQRTVLDFARFLATEETDEPDSNDPGDPDSRAYDVTAGLLRGLQDLKAERVRPLKELLYELQSPIILALPEIA
jgi:hypothetical protein